MIYILLQILLISFTFSSTSNSDTTSILISEIEIYGGINESSTSTNISIIKNNQFVTNGQKNFEDLIQSISNLHYAGGTSRARYFQLRGLGELSQFSGEGAPHFYVGCIIDNIDFSGIGMIGILDDMKQIEIFKGPQSSSYGPNAMAGVINFISNDPGEDKNLNINGSIYSNNSYSYAASSSLKLTNKVLSRFTLSHNYTDGFINNISNKNQSDTNSKDESLFRMKFLYTPNKYSSILFTAYFVNLNNKYDIWTPDNNGFTTFSDFQGLDKQNSKALSIKSDYKLNNSILELITTYSYNTILYSYDGDWGNLNYWEEEYDYYENSPTYFDDEACNDTYQGYLMCPDNYYPYAFTDVTNRIRKSYSQELRVKYNLRGNAILTSGLYYSQIKEHDKRDGWLFAGAATNINSIFDIANYALYTPISYPITNSLLISSTLRFDVNHTKQNLKYSYYDIFQNEYENQIKDKNLIGGNIKINYQYNKSLILNAYISRGYKTSGINQTQYPDFDESFRIYDTESCNNLELGLNYNSKKYKLKLSSFYMERINPQLRLSHQYTNDPTSFDYATYNAKSAYHYGMEIAITARLSKFLTLSQSISILKTLVSGFEYQNNLYGDRELSHSPNQKYTSTLSYDFSKYITGLSLNAESNYVGEFYFEEQNNIKSKPYNLINMSLKYNYKNSTISLWVKNITNKKYAIRGYSFVLDPTYTIKSYQSFGDLRSIGITVNFNIKN